MDIIIPLSLIIFINIAYAEMLLTRKRTISYTLAIFIVNYLIIISGYIIFSVFLKNSIFYKYIAVILGLTLIIYIYLIFKEKLSKKIFTMFTIWVFSHILLIICSYIINIFCIEDFNLHKFYSTLLRIIIQLIFLPIIYLYFREPYKKMLKLVSNKVINIISVYSIAIFLFLNHYYEFYNRRIDLDVLFGSMLNVIIIILSYIIIFIAIWSINKNMELEYKFKIIDTQVELQKQNYMTLNKNLEKFYTFKHDLRHHILAMKTMMDAENYIAASEYINKFVKDEISQNVSTLCKNFTVDSILRYYMSMAIKSNIDFKADLNIPENINIDNLDLSIVIGNCVENSIEACNNIMDENGKYINIKAEIIGLQLVIKIKNSFNGKIIKESNVIKTSKIGEGHGIGLSNVRNISQKYNGYFKVKYEDNEFEVCIIMNCK